MEHNNKPSIKDAILGKIRSRDVAMKPGYYFALKVVATMCVALLVLLISIFIFNFLLFSIRINSADTLLRFGPRGIAAFLMFFPWELLIIDVGLIALLQYLLRQFKFGYKIPVLNLLAVVIIVTAITGLAVDRTTGFNEHFLREADKHHLPQPIGDFYGHARRPMPPGSGFCKGCVVVAISGNVVSVQDPRNQSTTTIVLPENDDRATTTDLHVGDVIFVAGHMNGNTIEAFGIRKLGEPKQ